MKKLAEQIEHSKNTLGEFHNKKRNIQEQLSRTAVNIQEIESEYNQVKQSVGNGVQALELSRKLEDLIAHRNALQASLEDLNGHKEAEIKREILNRRAAYAGAFEEELLKQSEFKKVQSLISKIKAHWHVASDGQFFEDQWLIDSCLNVDISDNDLKLARKDMLVD